MSQAFQPPQHLAKFDFAPYNTRFGELDLHQQWNECCRVINELSVQIIELEIYDGDERNFSAMISDRPGDKLLLSVVKWNHIHESAPAMMWHMITSAPSCIVNLSAANLLYDTK